MGAFQFSAGSSITVYLTASSAFIPALEVSYLVPLAVILFYKVVGTNLMRLYLSVAENRDAGAGAGRVR
jgi:nucleoside recognition membrane protein YjiH